MSHKPNTKLEHGFCQVNNLVLRGMACAAALGVAMFGFAGHTQMAWLSLGAGLFIRWAEEDWSEMLDNIRAAKRTPAQPPADAKEGE